MKNESEQLKLIFLIFVVKQVKKNILIEKSVYLAVNEKVIYLFCRFLLSKYGGIIMDNS